MSDRLTELQRQRALAQEQLAWFDREIAKETARSPAMPVIAGASPVPIALAITPVSDAATAHVADEIIARYEKNSQSAATDVKRGCYLWFSAALGLLAAGAVGIYLFYARR